MCNDQNKLIKSHNWMFHFDVQAKKRKNDNAFKLH